jgi:membrane-bound lytic murein transglycosylase B
MTPHKRRFLILGLALMVSFGMASASQAQDFNSLVADIRAEARSKGIRETTLNRALSNIQPVESIKRLENFQPETVKSFADYYRDTVTQTRIQRGQALMRQHAAALKRAEDAYGVPAQYIVAIWAMESNFGGNMGNYEVIPSLITLARDGKNENRRAYFRGEAINALKILDMGYDEILTRRGSWAGAFGHTQFMPDSFLRLAVDGDGDGHKDVWNNLNDVFASTGNYLRHHKWKTGERWGRAVKLPPGFDKSLLTHRLTAQVIKTPTEWARLGVTLPNGAPLPGDSTMRGRIIAPDGLGGPTFIVYDNFVSIMRYNSSYKYALSVAGLADGIAAARGAALNQ